MGPESVRRFEDTPGVRPSPPRFGMPVEAVDREGTPQPDRVRQLGFDRESMIPSPLWLPPRGVRHAGETTGMKDILDRLAEGVIDGPGDLMGIGECLNLIESLENDAEFQGRRAPIVNQLKLRFKRIVLEESSSPENDWREIRHLIFLPGQRRR